MIYPNLKAGVQVKHVRFGRGTITDRSDDSMLVEFPAPLGLKQFTMAFAGDKFTRVTPLATMDEVIAAIIQAMRDGSDEALSDAFFDMNRLLRRYP